MVSIVRNPTDLIHSYTKMNNLGGYSLRLMDSFPQQQPHWWKAWVISIAQSIQSNHDYIVNTVSKRIPTYIIRYEDLLMDPETTLN